LSVGRAGEVSLEQVGGGVGDHISVGGRDAVVDVNGDQLRSAAVRRHRPGRRVEFRVEGFSVRAPNLTQRIATFRRF